MTTINGHNRTAYKPPLHYFRGTMLEQHLSLFELVRTELADTVPVILCNKATLVHISHTLEDVVLKHELPALMFTGFQESSHWRKETERYRALAQVAQQVCIFAGQPLPVDSNMNAIQIELQADDPLRQEWFVVILSGAFSALLCGKDNLTPTQDEGLREFETILTFDPLAINRALNQVEMLLAHYRPDVLHQLQEARRTYPVPEVDISLVNLCITEMLNFESMLTRRLRNTRDDLLDSNLRLRQERDYNTALLDTSPAMVVTLDHDSRILTANAAALQQLGVRDMQSIVGQTFWDVWALEVDRAQVQDEISKVQSIETTHRFEAPFHKNDDHLIFVEWHCHRVPLAGHDQQAIFAMGIDISDRKRASALHHEEQRLRIELEKERELNALRDKLMTTVSHEFRTPLATILTSSEMLERYFDSLTPEARRRRIDNIKQHIAHLTAMVDDISTIIRSSNQVMVYKPQAVDLLELTHNIIRDISRLFGQTHRILLMQNWPHSQVMVDERLYKHIISNLLSNALKYSEKDVLLRLESTADQIVLEVEDFGIGIPEEDQKRIYESFYRGNNVGNVEGTGLGLRIVLDSVKLSRGDITFHSAMGTGTTFTVRLPLELA